MLVRLQEEYCAKGKKLYVEYIGHVSEMSVSGYTDWRFKPRMYQYVISLHKTHILHCFG